MTEEIELPQQWTHSIKLEETAKGVRLSVHVYANDRKTAMSEAILTYTTMKGGLVEEEIPMAPMEIEAKK